MASPNEIYIPFDAPQEIISHSFAPDNNSLFKSISFALYSTESFHSTIRHVTNNALKNDTKAIPPQVMINDEVDVWSTEFRNDIANTIASVMNCRLIIYDYNELNKSIDKHIFGTTGYPVKIIRKGNKLYEVLTLRTPAQKIEGFAL